jgi:transposase-like protein
LYSQQLLLRSQKERRYSHIVSSLPVFRKKIYTKETIDFIIKQVQTGAKTAKQLSEEYDIPKPTIYRWLNKCSKEIKSKKAPAAKSISGGNQ